MRRRLDIQGLRAVSVLVVALDHANVSVLAGGFIGVDVFFVLSGFLITSLLVAEAADSQGVSISGFYARRARRILPAATLTLVATAIASSLILNFVRAKEVFIDVISAGFFVSNFRFSHSTDYFAQSQPPSPVQQFWSLSVEEQFYVVWPLLLAALVGATIIGAKRAGKQQNLRWGRLLGGLTVVTLASFVWSVISTSADPAPAYFSTFTRIWELAFGALLAIALSGKVRAPVRMPRPSPALLGVAGWAGLAMIITAALTFSPSTVFPGYAALLPTLGAVLIIAAGSPAEGVKWGVWGLLGLRPLGYVGDRSYALYLWHWPVLVLAAEWAGHDLSVPVNLGLVAAAFVISILSYRYVEDPLRRRKWNPPNRALALWPVSIGVVVLVAGIGLMSAKGEERQMLVAAAQAASAQDLKDIQGDLGGGVPVAGNAKEAPDIPRLLAAAVAESRNPKARFPSPLSPTPAQVAADHVNSHCGAAATEIKSKPCSIGSGTNSKKMVLLGDSHAEMWLPVLSQIAAANNWTVIPLIKAGCTPLDWKSGSGQSKGAAGGSTCRKWFAWASRRTKDLKPDLIIAGGNTSGGWKTPGGPERMAASLGLAARAGKGKTRVVVLNDVPDRSVDPAPCLLSAGASPMSCAVHPSAEYQAFSAAVGTLAKQAKAGFLNPTQWFCKQTLCPLVVGDMVTYVDPGHITKTYSVALKDVLASELGRVSGYRFKSASNPASGPSSQGDGSEAESLASVKAAVTAMRKPGSKFPAVLDPTLNRLPKDVYNEPCQAGSPLSRSSKICPLVAANATKRVALLGDSHAKMWAPALIKAATANNWTVIPIIKVGCTPVQWVGGTGPEGQACAAWFKWALREAARQKADTVLVGGHFADKVSGNKTDQYNAAPMLAGYAAAVKGLSGKRSVIVLNDSPDHQKDPTNCLLARGSTPAGCAESPSVGFTSFAANLRSLATGSGAGFIDPTPWLCYNGLCPLVVGNKVTYSDKAHVSATYSASLAGPFAEAVKSAISRRK